MAETDIKSEIVALISGIILVAAGVMGASITAGISQYVLTKFNATGVTIPASYNFFNQVAPLLSVVAIIVGVGLLVVGAVFIIRKLVTSVSSI